MFGISISEYSSAINLLRGASIFIACASHVPVLRCARETQGMRAEKKPNIDRRQVISEKQLIARAWRIDRC